MPRLLFDFVRRKGIAFFAGMYYSKEDYMVQAE